MHLWQITCAGNIEITLAASYNGEKLTQPLCCVCVYHTEHGEKKEEQRIVWEFENQNCGKAWTISRLQVHLQRSCCSSWPADTGYNSVSSHYPSSSEWNGMLGFTSLVRDAGGPHCWHRDIKKPEYSLPKITRGSQNPSGSTSRGQMRPK